MRGSLTEGTGMRSVTEGVLPQIYKRFMRGFH